MVVKCVVKKESEVIFGECMEFIFFFPSIDGDSFSVSQLFRRIIVRKRKGAK
jgi:hypothetical protein